jgi:hypothetical protein
MPHPQPHEAHPPSSPQARRSDAGKPKVTARDITGLTFTAQMYGAPYDLLAVKLGVTENRVRGIVLRWRRAGLADSAVLAQGPAWCWVTQQGLAHLGYPWTAQPPAMSRLAHIRAVLACRMWLESGHTWQQHRARWRPERQIRAAAPGPGAPRYAAGRTGHVPDAEVTWPAVDGSPHAGATWAIEVELTPKTQGKTQAIMSGLLAAPYACIVYLCSPATLAVVTHAASRFRPEQQARITIAPVPRAALMPRAAS